MCEHARSTGLIENMGRSPSSAGLAGHQSPLFPSTNSAIIAEESSKQVVSKSNNGGGFYRRVYPSIRNLFLRLQEALTGVPLPHTPEKIASVLDMLEALNVDEKEWSDFARFDGTKYTRSLVAHDSAFTVLLLCWNKGQRSPIHDHAGSSCWVKVLKGTLRERRFAFPDMTDANHHDKPLELIGDCSVSNGNVCYINDSQGIHEMGNPSNDEVTVTLHVYCPAYYSCYAFNETNQSHRCVSMLSAAAPQREVLGPPTTTDSTSSSGNNKECPVPEDSLSLPQFAKLMDNPRISEEQAVEAFGRLFLGKAEWSSFVHFNDHRFQRLMLHSNHRFSLLMLCWLPGQQTPPHDHRGSKSWVKVLSGDLFYHEVDDQGKPIEGTSATLTRCMEKPFVEDDTLAVHVVGNNSETFAVSLHFYSPPYTDLTYTDLSACGGKCSPPLSPKNALKMLSSKSGSLSQLSLDNNNNNNLTSPTAQGQQKEATTATSAEAESMKKDEKVVSHHVIPFAVCQQAMNQIQKNGGCCGGGGENNKQEETPENGPYNRLLSNFFILQEKLGLAFSSGCGLTLKELSVAVMEILENQEFSVQELDQYWQLRDRIDYRVRLHDSESFCVSLNLWNPEHESVIHDHDGSLSWVKVLDGSLMDTLYEEADDGSCLEEANTSRLITGSVTFYGAKAKHALANVSKNSGAISLHVYCSKDCVASKKNPPQAQPSQETSGEKKNVLSVTPSSNSAVPKRADSAGQSFFTSKSALVMYGTKQACRWYTRGAPKNGIRVMSLTAVEDTNWRVGAFTSPKNALGGTSSKKSASIFDYHI